MKFSIGYNHDIKLLDLLDVYQDHIESLYFPIPRRYVGSGRHIFQHDNYLSEIPEIIRKCNTLHIRSQLLLNASCVGESGFDKKTFSKILEYIQKLRSIGLQSVVVANPVYISEIKERIKEIVIESSVNCYVKTVEQALYLKDLGVDILAIDRDINRDIPLIKEIKSKTGLKIKMMLNEGCLRNCPFRQMHYNLIAHGKFDSAAEKLGGIFFDRWCIKIFSQNPAKVLSVPFIPPDALPQYAGFVDYFKISSRDASLSLIELRLKAYINRKFAGNLKQILDCPGLDYFEYINYDKLKNTGFFQKLIKCDGNCARCNYCDLRVKDALVINSDYLKGSQKREEDRKALKILKGVLKASPDKAPLYGKLSKVYFRLGEYQKAVETAYRVIDLNPREIDPYTLLGAYYEKTQDYDKAVKIYKSALKVFSQSGFIWFRLGEIYYYLKKHAAAIRSINKALKSGYRDVHIYYILGSCYERVHRYSEAIEALRKEEMISPEDARINLLLARCYRKTGRIEQSDADENKGLRKLKVRCPRGICHI